MWTPEGKSRYTWQYETESAGTEDTQNPRRLVDLGDGALIEAVGSTLLRYPTATLDDDGLIVNESGECLVVQNSGWDPTAPDFWEQLEGAALADHPVWEDARHQGQPVQRSRSKKADPMPPAQPAPSE
jgi:hypothetical protein